METVYVCILTLLGVFAMMLWLVFHFQRARDVQEERLRSVNQALEGSLVRLTRLEEASKKGPVAPGPEKGVAPASSKDRLLTLDGIAEAVEDAGYTPEKGEGGLVFRRNGETYIIDARRLPRFFVSKTFRIKPQEWDMDLLKQAACRMTDDIIMVKGSVNTEPDEDGDCSLRIYLAAMDRTYRSFRANLADYVQIIDDADQRLGEIYRQISEEKQEAASLNGLASSSFQQNGKTPS